MNIAWREKPVRLHNRYRRPRPHRKMALWWGEISRVPAIGCF